MIVRKNMPLRFDIVTIFPGFFDGPFRFGVLKRAIDTARVEIALHDLRQWAVDKHKTVDDRPFGGGEGMVLKPEPLFAAVESLGVAAKAERDCRRETVVLLSAQGERFTQAVAQELASSERVVLLCGRYEGVDERVNEGLADREISVGDFVLSGGELAAALVVDAAVRLLAGVLGNEASSQHESFGLTENALVAGRETEVAAGAPPSAVHGAGGLLDYPHYTRPAEFRGVAVPEVLAGGDHAAIKKWRRQRALEKTWRNRPDLLAAAELSKEDQQYLEKLKQVQK
jgi:tRNA (guanine37-N1)-methyltransferase